MLRAIVVPLLAALALTAYGRVCRGVLRGQTIFSDVTVPSGVCWLEDVRVTGSVRVGSGASIATMGRVAISGSMMVSGAREAQLRGNLTILGGFTASNTPRVAIGSIANVGMASVSNVGFMVVQGSMTSLSIAGGGRVEIRGGRVLGGGVSRRGSASDKPGADLVVCGATVLGGITMSMVPGNLNADVNQFCRPSELSGAVLVEKGVGNVKIVGNAMRAADVLITDQTGNVTIGNAVVSDMSMSRVVGSIHLDRVQADSDSNISGNRGPITMTNSALGGDMILANNQAVTVRGNQLGNEMLTISGNSGFVTVAGNTGFSGSILENEGVLFRNNVAFGAAITKNRRGTTITGNTLGLGGLTCADNTPPPRGGMNKFAPIAQPVGQCANLRM